MSLFQKEAKDPKTFLKGIEVNKDWMAIVRMRGLGPDSNIGSFLYLFLYLLGRMLKLWTRFKELDVIFVLFCFHLKG